MVQFGRSGFENQRDTSSLSLAVPSTSFFIWKPDACLRRQAITDQIRLTNAERIIARSYCRIRSRSFLFIIYHPFLAFSSCHGRQWSATLHQPPEHLAGGACRLSRASPVLPAIHSSASFSSVNTLVAL